MLPRLAANVILLRPRSLSTDYSKKMTTLSLSCHPANRERSVKYPYQYSGFRLNHLPCLPVREALCSN
uniref:Cation efflux system protein CusC n=1 Tax=Klebsiella pneumoniae TaxID=573 RepID=A0A8B0STI8_KLEPN|nr:Cation efflux system protein CusC precursor [Klebsiella pneumoniae]